MHYWYLIYGLERARHRISYAATLTNDTPAVPVVLLNLTPIPESSSLDRLAASLVVSGDARARESFHFLHPREVQGIRLPSVQRVVAVGWKEQLDFIAHYRSYCEKAKRVLV